MIMITILKLLFKHDKLSVCLLCSRSKPGEGGTPGTIRVCSAGEGMVLKLFGLV